MTLFPFWRTCPPVRLHVSALCFVCAQSRPGCGSCSAHASSGPGAAGHRGVSTSGNLPRCAPKILAGGVAHPSLTSTHAPVPILPCPHSRLASLPSSHLLRAPSRTLTLLLCPSLSLHLGLSPCSCAPPFPPHRPLCFCPSIPPLPALCLLLSLTPLLTHSLPAFLLPLHPSTALSPPPLDVP